MYLVVDIETTGGSHKTGKIIEIAAVQFDGQDIVDTFETLLNPECYLPPFITHLTGIDDRMLKNAPKFYQIAKQFVEFSKDTLFVAHNVSFDYNFIRTEYKNLGYDFERDYICTMQMSRKFFPQFTSHGLENLSRQFCIRNNSRHRAMGDAMATVELLKIILEEQKMRKVIP